ncbi:uncharacterized protein LOC121801305 [Salvia splendens]|uniref:uncharacterized protein LOC121801305 n=1 Tax=Salvia splendens TaxID=180675 RepID=UPI001C26F659|nr:uncharacterized protein LOC121801305 [Salvia splendens]
MKEIFLYVTHDSQREQITRLNGTGTYPGGDFVGARRFLSSLLIPNTFHAKTTDTQLMVKPKQRQIHRSCGKKHQNQRFPHADPPDDGDWMVVKKQKITIIIPPMPNKKHSEMPTVEDGQLQEKPRSITNSKSPRNTTNSQSPNRKTNSQVHCSSANTAKLSVHELDKSRSSEEQAVQPQPQPPLEVPNVNFEKPPSSSHQRTTLDNSPLRGHREGNDISLWSIPRSRQGMKIFADSTSFLNQRMRASYLEKKLRKAGGLENWLDSLGLARFIKVFQMRRVGKFQLANLTMQKLKDMGTDAVGPRRKLMHAIDCLCEPHCFQHI